MTDLINASSITPILTEAMGTFDPPVFCQVGVSKVREPGEHFNNLGYRDKDMPYFNAETHMDGSLTIAIPQDVQEGSEDDIYQRYIASGPKGDLGRSPDVIGHNMGPLFDDPEMTLGLGSFTAFVFVCLNDQSVEGRGQTALLRGAHHATEKFFRWQYETNGKLGPEGPGWPRPTTKRPIDADSFTCLMPYEINLSTKPRSRHLMERSGQGQPKFLWMLVMRVSPCTTFLSQGREMNWVPNRERT